MTRGHTAPAAKRVRTIFDGVTVVDSSRALYLWEHPYYPQFYVPAEDVAVDALVTDGRSPPAGPP
ncbi:MAG: DUF427 domain-containing protein [Ornithinimicrobium sp.]